MHPKEFSWAALCLSVSLFLCFLSFPPSRTLSIPPGHPCEEDQNDAGQQHILCPRSRRALSSCTADGKREKAKSFAFSVLPSRAADVLLRRNCEILPPHTSTHTSREVDALHFLRHYLPALAPAHQLSGITHKFCSAEVRFSHPITRAALAILDSTHALLLSSFLRHCYQSTPEPRSARSISTGSVPLIDCAGKSAQNKKSKGREIEGLRDVRATLFGDLAKMDIMAIASSLLGWTIGWIPYLIGWEWVWVTMWYVLLIKKQPLRPLSSYRHFRQHSQRESGPHPADILLIQVPSVCATYCELPKSLDLQDSPYTRDPLV